VSGHPLATVFHDARWLEALRVTYHYEPVVFTTSNLSEALENGWVFCQVDSWLTGRRLVSLPFSDHCDPLIDSTEELDAFANYLRQQREEEKWSYVEARPLTIELNPKTFHTSSSYLAQQLSLAPSSRQLFARLHRDSIRRKIRRAEREGVIVQEDRSGALLEQFYYLQLMTRRRHRLPPQPRQWFRNVVRCFGDSCAIYVANLHGQPIASILTLRFRKVLVYKYGASDVRFHALGAMPLLFWRIVEQAKDQGLEDFDLGRSALGNLGLITFKEHLGAHGHQINYYRQSSQQSPFRSKALPKFVVNGLCTLMPACVTNAAGKVLYRHIG
jgi:Acetyltransferase (GNAT) domain